MTDRRAVIAIVDAANADMVNAVWQYTLPGDMGPDNFSIPLSNDNGATLTHVGVSFAVIDKADAELWQGLTDGTMPDGIAWGTGDIPEEADAIAACDKAHLMISSIAGDLMSPVDHMAAIKTGSGLVDYIP